MPDRQHGYSSGTEYRVALFGRNSTYGLADGGFSFFQSSWGMNCNVHTKGHSELAILMLLTFLALLVVVLIFFHSYCGMSYAVHNKGMNHAVHTGEHSGSAILVFLTFLALLVFVF